MGKARRICELFVDHSKEDGQYAERKEFWEDSAYSKYKSMYGEHFTDNLAECASKHLKNNHGDKDHCWTVEQVKQAFESLGYKKPEANTWGDVAYAANEAYAVHYGHTLKNEVDCIKHAYAVMSDANAYSTVVFTRWLTDTMARKEQVDWEQWV